MGAAEGTGPREGETTARTAPSGDGSQSASTSPVARSTLARLRRAAPPIVVNAPPTYARVPTISTAYTGPSVSGSPAASRQSACPAADGASPL